MKAQSRILGVDDAPFKFTDEHVPVVGVVVRAPSYVEGVLTTRVRVDGADATEALASAINRSSTARPSAGSTSWTSTRSTFPRGCPSRP
jgi:endonuclease V-like protein UPF0215 family